MPVPGAQAAFPDRFVIPFPVRTEVLVSTPSPSLSTQADVTLADAAGVIDRVIDHLAGHDLPITRLPNGGAATFLYGEALMETRPGGLVMRATASNEAALSYMKGVMASHLLEYAGETRPEIVWTGDGADAAVYPNFREMTVMAVREITPHMRRITLSGENLDSFATGGLHFKLFVPPAGLDKPEWPVPGKDGLPIWPADDKRPAVRTYTIRAIDAEAGTFDADFVLHGDQSVGSRWALNAKPGDLVGVRGPTGRGIVQADWYLLVGDETALPAIARHLEALPASARGVALIEVADESERQAIETASGIEIRWLYRNGAEPGTTTLLIDAVRAVEMPEPGTSLFAMAGVEAETFKAIRQYWREELRLDKKDILPSTYWRRGKAEGE